MCRRACHGKEAAFDRENIRKFELALYCEEREASTVEVYLRNLRRFAAWTEDKAVDKDAAIRWKAALA